jgi:GntR family transcriptional regulator
MEIKVDHSSYKPLHVQVEELLRKMIQLDEYINGKLLPNETELASRLGISRNTVRAGIDKLVTEGLVERKRGVGTRVLPKKICSARLGSWISYTKEIEKQGLKAQTFYCKAEKVEAPKIVRDAFNLPEKTMVLILERVKGYNNVKVIHTLSYFHPRIGLTGNEDFTRPLYDILETDYHVIAENSFEKIKAVAADKWLAKHLDVKTGFPLLCRERIVTDPGGRFIEFNIHHHRSDKYVYTVDIQRS